MTSTDTPAVAWRYPESEGEVPPCDGCGGSTRYWHAVNRLWNFVMGGPEAKGDPGGVLCPNCFIDRAAATGRGRRWVLTDMDPDAAAPAPDLAMREAVARIVAAGWFDEKDGSIGLVTRYAGSKTDYAKADAILSLLRSTMRTGNQGGAT